MLASYTTENDTVEQGVASKSIVPMHATSDFACSVKTRDGFATSADASRVHVNLKTAHAVMDHRSDDRHVKWLSLHCRAWDNVMEELFARASRPTCIIPRLAT